jgi:hypothetical protein
MDAFIHKEGITILKRKENYVILYYGGVHHVNIILV